MNQLEAKKYIRRIRQRVLKMAYECGENVHIGGALSMLDILSVLYKEFLRFKPMEPDWQERDRFVLSKGHCVMALYAVLADCGFIEESMLDTFQKDESDLGSHPVMNIPIGIESSNGSLGQGVSMAVGIAKAAKIKKQKYRVYTLIGNGESNEGAVWEAAMLAAAWKLDNLTIILDNNQMQSDGESIEVLDMGNLKEKWTSFGFTVLEIDGHDYDQIYHAFTSAALGCPKIIIANTIKGHGVSFMEGKKEWHHNRLTQDKYLLALSQLEENV